MISSFTPQWGVFAHKMEWPNVSMPFWLWSTGAIQKLVVVNSSFRFWTHCYPAHAQGVKQSSVVVVVVRTKIASLGVLGPWATCKANEYIEIGEKLASVCFELLCTGHNASVTNSAFLALPVDHTYLLGHVLFARAHNCHRITGSGHQQALLYRRCMFHCCTISDTVTISVQMLRAGYVL